MDINECAENLGLEKEEFMELLTLFVETAHADLDKIQAALSEMDGNRAASAAHSIKGASANLGLTEMSDLAKAVENLARREELNGIPPYMNKIRKQVEVVAASAGC